MGARRAGPAGSRRVCQGLEACSAPRHWHPHSPFPLATQSSGTLPPRLWTGRPGCGVWGWWDSWDPPWEGGFLPEAAEDNAGKGIDVGGGVESPKDKREVPVGGGRRYRAIPCCGTRTQTQGSRVLPNRRPLAHLGLSIPLLLPLCVSVSLCLSALSLFLTLSLSLCVSVCLCVSLTPTFPTSDPLNLRVPLPLGTLLLLPVSVPPALSWGALQLCLVPAPQACGCEGSPRREYEQCDHHV